MNTKIDVFYTSTSFRHLLIQIKIKTTPNTILVVLHMQLNIDWKNIYDGVIQVQKKENEKLSQMQTMPKTKCKKDIVWTASRTRGNDHKLKQLMTVVKFADTFILSFINRYTQKHLQTAPAFPLVLIISIWLEYHEQSWKQKSFLR